MEENNSERERRVSSARVLCRSSCADLAEKWSALVNPPSVPWVRKGETGIVMVQGRMGGSGDRFHAGEAVVSRATARITHAEGDSVGTAYVLGSQTEHAEFAAIFEAMLDSPLRRVVEHDVLEPLAAQLRRADDLERAQARSSVVEFFTTARENMGSEEDE